MARKKSLKNAGNKAKAGQKSKDRKRRKKVDEVLIQETHGFLENPGEGLPAAISARIFDLDDDLQGAFFRQLIEEAGENSIPLMTQLVGKSESMDLMLAESLAGLPVAESVDLLYKIAAGTGNKIVKKAAKRSLYRLREKGVVGKDRRSEDSQASILRIPAGVSEGYLSSIDYLGDRLVWLARPRAIKGLYFFQALINDMEGIEDLQGMEIPQKMYREYLARFKEESPMPIVEAEPSYCQFLIEEGYATANRRGHALPGEYLEWKGRIGRPRDEAQRPLIYSCYDEETIRSNEHLVMRSRTLFELPEFGNWVIPPDEIRKYTEMIEESNESKLILTPIQKQERISRIYNDAVEELFKGERRLLYKRRLEEMAYVLYKLGKEEGAKISLAASLALKDSDVPASHHPFLLGLMERSLSSALWEEEQREKENPPFIIKP